MCPQNPLPHMPTSPAGAPQPQPPVPPPSALPAPAPADPSAPVFPRYRWVIVALLCSIYPLNSFVSLSIGVLLPYIRDDITITNSQAGILSGAAFIASIFLSIPAALFVVRMRAKWVFAAAIGSIAAVLFLHSLASVFVTILLARLLFSITGSVTQPAISMLRTQWVPKRESALVGGLQMAAQNVGQSIALVAIPFLVGALNGWRLIYVVYGCMAIFLFILWLFFGKERGIQEYAPEGVRTNGPRLKQRVRETAIEYLQPLRAALRYKEFWLVALSNLGNILPFIAIITFWPTFLIEDRGITRGQAAMLMAFLPVGGLAASVLNSYLSDRVGLRRPFIWPAGVISPIVYVCMVQSLPIPALAALSFLAGYLCYSPLGPLQGILYELPGIKPREIASGYAFSLSVGSLSFVLGPILAGFLADNLSGGLRLALMLSAIGPIGVVIAGLGMRETGWRRPQPPTSTSRR